MRRDVEQKVKSDSPVGIRIGVWLIVLSLAFLCALVIRHANGPAPDTATKDTAGQGSAKGLVSRELRPARKISALPSAYQEKEQSPAALTAEEAKSRARSVANQKAEELYGCKPFGNGPPARFVEGRWIWSDRRGQGSADIEARVAFDVDGTIHSVDVILLDNRALFRQPFRP